MRAAIHDRYGSPDVLRIADVPKPTPAADELSIRVLAASVNRTDCGFRQGVPWIVRFWSGLRRPRQPILGNELCGEVQAVGAQVTGFAVGDRVCGLLGDRFGAHAEHVCAKASAALVLAPARLSPIEAAGIWDGPWLALACLRKAGVERGTELLIYGASGSIGSSAVQLAKHFGAHVVAVCNTKHLALVKSLGADEVIDYTQTDFTRLSRQARSFDAVLDAVGKSTFAACKPLLKPSAIYVSTDLGPYWQNPWLHLLTARSSGKRAALAIPDEKRVRQDVELLEDIVQAGGLRPVIDRTYPFDQIVDAHRYVETEQKAGSVVLEIAAPSSSAGRP